MKKRTKLFLFGLGVLAVVKHLSESNEELKKENYKLRGELENEKFNNEGLVKELKKTSYHLGKLSSRNFFK